MEQHLQRSMLVRKERSLHKCNGGICCQWFLSAWRCGRSSKIPLSEYCFKCNGGKKQRKKFGSAASAYLHAVAPHKDGDPNLLDLDKGGKAISDLGKAHSMLGPEFQTVLSQAVANHADNPSAMNSFIAGHYNDAKMNAPVEQKEIANPVNDSHEGLPPVMDTPTFNPTTGEVEGGAVNSEPQQASLDFTPVNQATIDQFGAEQISVPNNEPPKISDGDINDV